MSSHGTRWRLVPFFTALASAAAVLLAGTATAGQAAAAEPYAWQSESPYLPPDFESFFPDEEQAGKRLDSLWNDPRKDRRADAEILACVRNGLRRTSKHRTLILRWIGNKYIWNKKIQNPDAIEIMYHATAGDKYGTRHYAVYFGLSVVHQKTPAILRTLVDLCIRVDDPNDLGRVAWGCRGQRPELVSWLTPYLESEDTAVRQKAEAVRRIFTGELKAFTWAKDRLKQEATEKHAGQLPQIREQLRQGDSAARMKLLGRLQSEGIVLIMDESFLDAFAACARDEDARVRAGVARVVGSQWIWSAQEQSAPAIDLLLQLSHDPVRDVRTGAVYFGLSTVREDREKVVARLLELAYADREWNLFSRITWGLSRHRSLAQKLLEQAMDQVDTTPETAVAAYQIYADIVGHAAPHPERFEGLEAKYAGDHGVLMVFAAKGATASQRRDTFVENFRKAFAGKQGDSLVNDLVVSDDGPTLHGVLFVRTMQARDQILKVLKESPNFQLSQIVWTTPAQVRQLRQRHRKD